MAYTPAQITAASLLTSWKFSNEHDAVPRNLSVLAAACGTEEVTLSTCANELVKYYTICFPEAAKSFEQVNLFIPIPEESSCMAEIERSESPDSIMAPMQIG